MSVAGDGASTIDMFVVFMRLDCSSSASSFVGRSGHDGRCRNDNAEDDRAKIAFYELLARNQALRVWRELTSMA